ncbi:MAG: hypothetical protein MJZ55_04915, partial [Paludibacteraceae bacterium]|nr:hypothetical protein [Paludibacteraceae bacterium]
EYSGTADVNKVISNILAPSYTDISVGIDWKPNSIFSIYLSPVAGRITTAYVSDKVNERFEDGAYHDGFKDLRESLQSAYGTWKYTDKGEDGYAKKYCNAKAELGLTLKGAINWSYKDLKIITGVTLYTPYAWDKTKLYNMEIGETTFIYSESQMIDKFGTTEVGDYIGYRDNNRRFGNFDVDWNVAISYQVLKVLNITLTTDLKYVNGLSINGGKEKVQFLANLGLGVSYAF